MKIVKMLLLGLLLVSPAAAQTSLHLVTEDWPPYGFLKDGRAQGLDVDLLQAAAARIGVKLEIEFLPWSRAMDMVTNGAADGIFSLYDLPERRSFLKFCATPLGEETLVVVYAKARPPRPPIRSLADLSNLRVGVLQDNVHSPEFDQATHFVREVSLTSDQALKKLLNGRMDVQVMNLINFRDLVNTTAEFKGQFAVTDYVVNQQKLYLGFSVAALKKKDLPVEKLTKALADLIREGKTKALADQYLGKESQ